MKNDDTKFLATTLLASILVLSFLIIANPVHADSATISTDQSSYLPQSIVTIYGSGFQQDHPITVSVTQPNGTIGTWQTTSDAYGSFSTTYQLDDLQGTYYVTATDGTNTAPTVAFEDAISLQIHHPDGTQYPPSHSPENLGNFAKGTPVSFTDFEVKALGLGSSGSTTWTVSCDSSFGDGSTICPLAAISPDSGTLSASTVSSISFEFKIATGSLTIGTTYSGHLEATGSCCTSATSQTGEYYFKFTVTASTASPLTVSKTATLSFTRTFTWGITKSVGQSQIDIASGGSATFAYTVSVTHDSGTDNGWKVSGTITVANPNSFAVTGVNVADTVDNGGSCSVTSGTGATIPASSSSTFSYSCTFSSNPGSGTNTATATWSTQGALAGGSASGAATYDFSATTPTIVDSSVTVTDTLGGTLGTVWHTGTSPTTFTYSHGFSGVAGTCTNYDNTATFTSTSSTTTGDSNEVTVKVCVGEDLTVNKTADTSFTRTYTWGISKSVDQTKIDIAAGGTATFTYTVSVTHDAGTDSDWLVSGMITVTNPNNWEAITFTLADVIDNGGSCGITGIPMNVGTNPFTIAASGSLTFAYSCTYLSAPSQLSGTNTATATWDSGVYSTPTGSASGTAAYAFTTPTTIVDGSVTVTDMLPDNTVNTLGTVSYTDTSPQTFTDYFTTYGVAGTCTDYTNTAAITSNSDSDLGVVLGSASKTVTVCVGEDLTVTKTATPTFTRTYNWQISKSVTPTLIEKLGGGTATASYTVKVSETDFVDSGWTVSGTITVTNPNNWEAITADVTDAIAGGTCTVTGGTGVVVPEASGGTPGSVQLSYTCTFASQPAYNIDLTNTATATWDSSTYYTPDGSASGSAVFQFTTPTSTTYKTVTITDTFLGVTTTLGTLTATDTTPYTSATYTFTRTITVPTWNCVTYTNTATIVQTGQTATASVEVCGPAQTGALTMGYWQNKNGQALITGDKSTGGVCNLATWLRQFNPFQDLSATATCSRTATYVTNVIKAATAGGSTMNPMLKAQMLATALDVYFSNPALGGNKIGAPAPIGGVTIDLTHIACASDGGSCTAGSVSSAFGGATSMTVLQMLQYASNQSNTSGSMWYGNVKTTQGLAKDAFDAINNQLAFSP